MVLVSGFGANPEQEIHVGVGTLAGSTVMLLTIAWWVSILGGRVDRDSETGIPIYRRPTGWTGKTLEDGSVVTQWEKLLTPADGGSWSNFFSTGVMVKDSVKDNCVYILGTLMPLVVVQVSIEYLTYVYGAHPISPESMAE